VTVVSDTVSERDVIPVAPGHRSRWDGLKRLSDRTPLRTKLITAVLALVILALAAISVASVVMLRDYVETRQDNNLKANFHPYLNRPTLDNGVAFLPQTHGPGSNGPIQPGYAYSAPAEAVWALQEPGTQVRWYSYFIAPDGNSGTGSGQAPLPKLPTDTNWASSSSWVLLSVPASSGPDTWRVIAQTQTYPVFNESSGQSGQEKLTLVYAVDLGDLSAMTTRLVIFDLIVGGAIVLVLAAVGAAVVRANLRPLNDIELTAGQIATGHLDHRVPEGDPRTEIGSLGRSLNAMLTQIESAFRAQEASEQAAHRSEERMRRFIADASHELRTPLTTIRGFAAHYRQRGGASRLRPGAPVQNSSFRTSAASPAPATLSSGTEVPPEGLTPEDLDHLMSRVESEATRMGLLVEDLLTLARLDQQRPLNLAPVDLLTLAADAVQDARVVSPGRPIDLVVAPGTAFLVNGDEARLRQVIGNLVNNALTHTPRGTPVRVRIARGILEARRARQADGAAEAPGTGGQTAPAVVIDVEDDGPGMSAEQAQRVFERFYRADAARNRASGGTGLGLAIVAGLVSAHGGTVSVRTAPGQGADFQVKLPLSPDALVVDDFDDDLLA
jgi:two-component system OmpR family sensor kinase